MMSPQSLVSRFPSEAVSDFRLQHHVSLLDENLTEDDATVDSVPHRVYYLSQPRIVNSVLVSTRAFGQEQITISTGFKCVYELERYLPTQT